MNAKRRIVMMCGQCLLVLTTTMCHYNLAVAQNKERPEQPILNSFNENVLPAFESLQSAVKNGDEADIKLRLLALENVLLKHQNKLKKLDSNPDAVFVNPPEEVQGVNHVLRVAVSPELLKQSDVWVGVKPVQAPDQIWLQGTRVSTAKSNQNVYLGLNGIVNEKFEVLVLSVPRGTFQREGPFRTNEVEKRGVEILASTVIHRTQ